MKNNAKRLLAFLLAALLCVTMIVPAFATETEAEHDHEHEVACNDDCTHECETKHANSEVIEKVDPKCTNAGYTLKYCFDCKHYFVTDPVPAAEDAAHNPGKEAVVPGIAPTCKSEGVEATYKCTVCGENCDEKGGAVDKIDPIDHEWKNGLCVMCGVHKDDVCKDGVHTWEFVEVTAKPTDTANGTATYKCEGCGAIKEVVILAENARFYPSSLYADIEFNADGTWSDRLGKLEVSVVGTPTIGNENVTHNGKTITIPTLQATGNNVGLVTFKDFASASDASAFFNDADGFSYEVLFIARGETTGIRGVFCSTETTTMGTGMGIAMSGAKPYVLAASNSSKYPGYVKLVANDDASATEMTHIVATFFKGTAKDNRDREFTGLWMKVYINGELACTNTPMNYGGASGNGQGSANAYVAKARSFYVSAYTTTFVLGADINKNTLVDGTVDYSNTVGVTSIADLKVYSSALTADEVSALYGYVVKDFETGSTTTPETPETPDEHKCTVAKVDAVAGTCTTKGTIAHYACACGKLYSDAEAKNEITSIEGDYKHEFGDTPTTTVNPGCETYGYKMWACTLCGVVSIENIAPKGHANWDDTTRATNVVKTDATCKNPGKITWTCDCNKAMSKDLEATGCTEVTVEVAATCYTFAYKFTYCTNANCDATAAAVPAEYAKHIAYAMADAKVTNFNVTKFEITGTALDAANHYHAEYGVVIPGNEADCKNPGTKVDFCEGCHTIDKSYPYGPEGHKFVNETPVAGATCTTAATFMKTCEYCGTPSEVYTKGEALGHTAGTEQTIAPSCAGDGEKFKLCTVCGVKVESTKIPFETKAEEGVYKNYADAAAEHKNIAAEGVFTPVREGNCVLVGLVEYACTDCGKPVYVQTGVGGEGHKWTDDPADTETETTVSCTQDGYERAQVCSVCSATKPAVVTPAYGHAMTEVAAKDATCTEAGNDAHFYCSNCTKTFEDEEGETEINAVINALGHNFVASTCTRCGDECKHTTTTLYQTSVAACDKDGNGTYGYKYWTCDDCDYECWTEFEDIPAHDYKEVVEDATCYKTGKKYNQCACGLVEAGSVVVLPEVHKNAADETFYNSCLDEETDRDCVLCNQTIGKDHNTVTTVVDHDCQNEGYEIEACVDCGTVVKTTAYGTKGEHKWVNVEGDDAYVAPTYATEGSQKVVCSVCGANETQVLDKLAGLNLELVATNKYDFVEYVNGSFVTVKVLANANNVNMWSFKLKVNYNEEVLNFVEGVVATEICGTTTNGVVNAENGVATIVGFASNNADGKMQNVALNGDKIVLATLTFRVDTAEKVDAGFYFSYPEIIDMENTDVDEALAEAGELTPTNTTISTNLYLDINNDGVIDLEDLNSMAKILANEVPEDAEIIRAAADANHDGTISEADLALLLECLSSKRTADEIVDSVVNPEVAA